MRAHLRALRKAMETKNLDGFIITSNDPHLSEYTPKRWRTIEWLTGFSGSVGTVAITQQHATLWTDSRYTLQAQRELKGTGVSLTQTDNPSSPTVGQWLAGHLASGSMVATDGQTISHIHANEIKDELTEKGIDLNCSINPIDSIWPNRPSPPNSKAYNLSTSYCGKSTPEKLTLIRQGLTDINVNTTIVTLLDEVAWALNIRGSDIDYNPVVTAHLIVTDSNATLYIDDRRLDNTLRDRLTNDGVTIKPYTAVESDITSIAPGTVVSVDLGKINQHLALLIPDGAKTVNQGSIISKLKAVKCRVEQENIKGAMVADGVALCRFLQWLEVNLQESPITEIDIASTLQELRAQQQGFVSESFSTIAAYADHGAIVHYSPTPATCYTIKPKGFLLIDSGGHYLHGTTDVTRTLHLGSPSRQERIDYTLVLKGMIGLSMAQFPEGTRGSQLDTIARMHLWSNGLNYGHGTGHGVGAFLNVHEGPQSISPRENPVAIEAGMVLTNEPGLYRTNMYGIRIENMMLCTQRTESEFGTFLGFESLTLCPIDVKPIEKDLLTREEKQWLNNYHQMVFDKLSAELNAQEKQWLQMKTQRIQ